jgi:hypothetical protein
VGEILVPHKSWCAVEQLILICEENIPELFSHMQIQGFVCVCENFRVIFIRAITEAPYTRQHLDW